MNQSADCVHQLIYGSKEITVATASKLSKMLGASEQFWLNRDKMYRESLSSINKVNEDKWLKNIPFKEMVDLGWIEDTGSRLETCLKFFNIENVDQWGFVAWLCRYSFYSVGHTQFGESVQTACFNPCFSLLICQQTS